MVASTMISTHAAIVVVIIITIAVRLSMFFTTFFLFVMLTIIIFFMLLLVVVAIVVLAVLLFVMIFVVILIMTFFWWRRGRRSVVSYAKAYSSKANHACKGQYRYFYLHSYFGLSIFLYVNPKHIGMHALGKLGYFCLVNPSGYSYCSFFSFHSFHMTLSCMSSWQAFRSCYKIFSLERMCMGHDDTFYMSLLQELELYNESIFPFHDHSSRRLNRINWQMQ